MMRPSLLVIALAWVHLSLGLLVRETGSRKLRTTEPSSGVSAQASIQTYHNTDAQKDNFISTLNYWDVVNGIQGQKYKVCEDHFDRNTGGPIFLLIGSETELYDEDIDESSFIYYAASKHNALVVGLEHRYHGSSYPTATISSNYLTAKQALADVNRFIVFLKKKYTLASNTPVIVFGYGYGGNLAAWFKVKYPHMAVGAISSSAPLVATVDFSQYLEGVGKALRYWGGDACYNAVKKGADDYYSYLAAGQYSKVSTDLGFSVSDFNDGIDAGGSCMIVPLSGIVEFNGINYADEPSVSKFCADFVSTTQASSAYNALIAFMKNRYAKDECARTEGANFVEDTAMVFQYCNEFGYLQSAVSSTQPFYSWGNIWEKSYLYQTYCADVFGGLLPRSQPIADTINTIYGGLNVQADNVTFVYGSLDPWSALGVPKGYIFYSHDIEVYYIDGGSHINDVYSPDFYPGSASLTNVRNLIELDLQYYLQGTPWAHYTGGVGASQASAFNDKTRASAPEAACDFDVVVKKTKATVKYGDQIKVAFSVRSRNPTTSDKYFVGFEHMDASIHFVKASVSPPVNRTKSAPSIEHDGGIFWENVPNRRSRTFKASFFSDRKGMVDLHPGVCLQDGTEKSCCKFEHVKVNVVDP